MAGVRPIAPVPTASTSVPSTREKKNVMSTDCHKTLTMIEYETMDPCQWVVTLSEASFDQFQKPEKDDTTKTVTRYRPNPSSILTNMSYYDLFDGPCKAKNWIVVKIEGKGNFKAAENDKMITKEEHTTLADEYKAIEGDLVDFLMRRPEEDRLKAESQAREYYSKVMQQTASSFAEEATTEVHGDLKKLRDDAKTVRLAAEAQFELVQKEPAKKLAIIWDGDNCQDDSFFTKLIEAVALKDKEKGVRFVAFKDPLDRPNEGYSAPFVEGWKTVFEGTPEKPTNAFLVMLSEKNKEAVTASNADYVLNVYSHALKGIERSQAHMHLMQHKINNIKAQKKGLETFNTMKELEISKPISKPSADEIEWVPLSSVWEAPHKLM